MNGFREYEDRDGKPLLDPVFMDCLRRDGGGAIFGGEPPAADGALSARMPYRFVLGRIWQPSAPFLTWVMLNPSTADEREDDPTISRCSLRARRAGFGGILVVNLFAFRSPYAWVLKDVDDPVGPGNDQAIVECARAAGLVAVAWGADGALHGRGDAVLGLILGQGLAPYCLGKTKEGFPRHPLYVRNDVDFERFA